MIYEKSAWPKRCREIQKLVSKFRGRDAAVVKAKLKNDAKMHRDFEKKQNREIGILAESKAAGKQSKANPRPNADEPERIFTWFIERQMECKGKKSNSIKMMTRV